ncbi:cytochrome b561 and DOMON domain-containing protein At3g25290-like [Phoenix dactylifera]|uniref:Cytochrome b561 and DOMON domain-containing protein n=1 Tax=Phoenix dactylifera TaxID=42345 RepID=A0A8B7CHT2_PHODC|nr:cytochrome b561 and DOMON domain-containing protein At3g25290-like [Phoenix dactylifera]
MASASAALLLLSAAIAAFCFLSPAAAAAAAQGCASQNLGSNRVFAACSDLPQLSSSIHWTYDRAAAALSIAFVAPPATAEGWVAWAINPTETGMVGSQALVAFRQADGKMGVKTYNITGYALKESKIAFETSDLAADYAGGVMKIFGTLKLGKEMTVVNEVWQVGGSVTNGVPDKHAFVAENLGSKGQLDLVRGVSSGSGGSVTKERNIHGVLNAVSWGILLPIGAIFARYLKTFKSADPAWFYLHLSCQLTGYTVGVAGWATGLNLGSKSKGVQYTTHRNIGITLFSLATLQVFALFLRPSKDHKIRFYWNIYHHLVGYTVIVLGVINVFKGLTILSPDQKWTTAYITVISILGGIALLLEALTWIIVLRRKTHNSTKPYGGSNSTNGHRDVQQPLSV